jgi:hypothetical protein
MPGFIHHSELHDNAGDLESQSKCSTVYTFEINEVYLNGAPCVEFLFNVHAHAMARSHPVHNH